MFIRKTLRLIFSSFLAIPTVVIAAFMLLALGSSMLEQADLATLRPFRSFMQDHVFGNTQATSNLLGTIAGGIITVTSITFSLLLLAMQQSAASMTAQVFDQFLQRRLNQLYFGFFVGIALYALPVLATVDPPFNPVLGASLALLLTIVALAPDLLDDQPDAPGRSHQGDPRPHAGCPPAAIAARPENVPGVPVSHHHRDSHRDAT